jgi:hypothetical protein
MRKVKIIAMSLVSVLIVGATVHARNYQITGALDSRFMFNDNQSKINKDNFLIHGVEVNFRYIFQGESGDWATLVLQGSYSPDFDYFSREFNYHYGDIYFVLKGPKGQVNLKIGKFVIPFGNLQYYTSHLLILQPMFQRSLGIREDIGIGVGGYFKDYEYDLSFTNGRHDGRIDFKNEGLFIFRLGKSNGDLKYGLSLLSGGAPEGEYMLGMMMKKDEKVNFVHKNRLGFDIQYPFRAFTLRGETVFGIDEKINVGGFYLGTDYEITPKILASLKYDFWDPDFKNKDYIIDSGLGLSYRMNKYITPRIAYEKSWAKDEMGMSESTGFFTVQLNLNF